MARRFNVAAAATLAIHDMTQSLTTKISVNFGCSGVASRASTPDTPPAFWSKPNRLAHGPDEP